MGFTEISISADGEFTGQGKLDAGLEKIKQQNAVDILKRMVATFVEVQKSYAAALVTGGKMHGHERFDLISHLDETLDLIITLRARFESNEVFVMAILELSQHLQIHIDFDK